MSKVYDDNYYLKIGTHIFHIFIHWIIQFSTLDTCPMSNVVEWSMDESARMKVRGWKCEDENAGMKMPGMKKPGDEKQGMKVKRWNVRGWSVTQPYWYILYYPTNFTFLHGCICREKSRLLYLLSVIGSSA